MTEHKLMRPLDAVYLACIWIAGISILLMSLIIPEIFVMSKVTWDKLSKDEQALVMKFSREAQMEQRALWDKSVAEYSTKLKAAGIQFVNVDKKAFYDATAPVRVKHGAQYAELIKRIEAVK